MNVRESIIVMNKKTWEMFKEIEMETASQQADPMEYLLSIGDLNVVIDDDTPDNITEVWYKDAYEFNQELKRIKKEMQGDN